MDKPEGEKKEDRIPRVNPGGKRDENGVYHASKSYSRKALEAKGKELYKLQ